MSETTYGIVKAHSDLLFDTLNGIKREIESRDWILEGRGPYDWDDDKYRQEAAYAFEAVLEIVTRAKKEGAQLWKEWKRIEDV